MRELQLTIAFQTDKALSAYGPLAARAEAYGFDGVSVYNDLWYQPAWLPLLEIARHTRRVRIGPAAVNPFTAHPIEIAGNLALLDAASHGRAYCGFARGAWLDSIGLTPQKPVAALREALACVRHLLRQNKAPLTGDHFPLQGGDSLRWQAIRADIPFLLGSWGRQTIRACLPFVSEIKLGGTANPGAVRWLKSFLLEQKTNLSDGDHMDDIGIVCGAVMVVDQDGRAARELARREVALYLPIVAALDPTMTIEPDRLAGIREAMKSYDVDRAITYISDELLQTFAFAGTPDEIIEQSLNLFAAGADRIEWGTPHGLSSESGLALLGEIVLPAIRNALLE
jgi:5,10-methylenetetrahydromethanopterin reductase